MSVKPLVEAVSELRSLYPNFEENTIIPFLGAGTSKLLGLPEWIDLVKNLIKDSGSTLIFEKEFNGKDNLPQIAQKVSDELDNYEQYREIIKQNLKPIHETATSLHYLLAKYFINIITTNFDTAFDDPFSIQGIETNELVYPNLELNEFLNRRAIAYLHGSIKNGPIIFRENDYKQAYENPNDTAIKSFIKSLVNKRNLLFIGFSFSDRYFVSLLEQTIKEVNANHKDYNTLFGDLHGYKKAANIYVISGSQYTITKVSKDHLASYGLLHDLDITKRVFEPIDVEQNMEIRIEIEKDAIEMLLGAINNNRDRNEAKSLIDRLHINRKNLKYFKENGITVLTYPRNFVDIVTFLKSVVGLVQFVDETTTFNPNDL